MPAPLDRRRRYLPGLDGLRAVAVLAVLAYHLGFGWAAGGLLGVGVFFTLSGYLITDLLLDAIDAGTPLRQFWLARARRLLPAVALLLAVVAVWVWIDDRAQLGVVRGQVLAALVYLSNWWQSFQHESYFARFAAPSPLNHLWSLSVEEQFYLVWPWLLMLAVAVLPERTALARVRPRLAAITLGLAVISAVEMAWLYHPSFDPSRIYYGTDTRAFGLLFGAALACVWPSRTLRTTVGRAAPWVLDLGGVVGLAAIGVLIWRTSEYSPFIYHGGLVLLSLATVLILAACVHPAARLGRVLGVSPLRWIGERSYGIYLWQTPIIVITAPTPGHAVSLPRAAAETVATFAVAAASWRWLEQPVRRGALGRLWREVRATRVTTPPLRLRWAAGGLGAAVAIVALALSGVIPSPSALLRRGPGGSGSGVTAVAGIVGPREQATVSDPTTTPSHSHSHPATLHAGRFTSCRSVVHIGDSTSEGMVSDDYLPDRGQQLPAQYARVGVHHSTMEITGGTSIIETLPGTTDARSVARGLIAGGYHGCWVIALGTNDTADVAVGSNVPLTERVADMEHVIGNQPALWVEARTLLSSGPYAESNMEKWNAALLAGCRRFPDMRVYDWPDDTENQWFIPDGIHYYSAGYAARAHDIADALASAFPRGTSPASACVVREPRRSFRVRGVRSAR